MNSAHTLDNTTSAVHRTIGTAPEQWTAMDHAVAAYLIWMIGMSNAIYDESITDEQAEPLNEARRDMAEQIAHALGLDAWDTEELAWDRWKAAGSPLY